uniref:Pentacotripeptide-repeat region of PRORP domain-containing protein n=1 Tax=Leersia perrieri TaxID=77586 RepID=A0A0D9UXB0_9ORYZ
MVLNAANSGGRAAAGILFRRAAASALPTPNSTAATATTPQRISHYLAHHPRATWEALSAAFPAAASPHGSHADAVLLSLSKHRHSSSPELVARNALTFFHWSASSSSSSSPHSLRAYCLLVHLLAGAAMIRDASMILESAIARHPSSPATPFLDAFFAAYEDTGTAATATTRGLHLLVHAYARARLPEEALEACRYLAQRGVIPSMSAFNAVLHAAQRSGRFGVAWEVFELMTLRRVYADQSTVELVIGVLSREGKLARMASLVERIHGKKCAPGVVAHVALTLRIFEEGRTEQGILLLRRVLQRSMVSDDIAYSLIVHAHCQDGDLKQGRMEECSEYMDKMLREGFVPDICTCNEMVEALCDSGEVGKANELLTAVMDKGFVPNQNTYLRLINGYGKVGNAEVLMSPGSPSQMNKEGTPMLESCLPDFAMLSASSVQNLMQAA